VAEKENGIVSWLLGDHLGSTAVTANSAGSKTGELRYYAFGGTRYTWGSTPTTYRYTGQRQESALGGLDGLYFYNARWYDPVLGRFLSPDTLVPGAGNPQALNRYAYTLNNPVKYRDPSGHWIETAFDIVSLGMTLNDIRNEGMTFWNGVSLATDVASLILPVVPAGASHAIRAAKWANKAVNAADAVHDIANVADTAIDAAKVAENAGDAVKAVENASDVVKQLDNLPDDALVCRGGLCTADRFAGGSGVTIGPDGTLSGVSVSSAPGKSVQELTVTYPNPQVGVTTVGQVRAAGGNVVPSPTSHNPYHATMYGITPQQAERLFTPTIPNPNRIRPR
jgi:RHS repeat-associated protein